jgi:arylsulfatase A-like enzyme
VRWPDVIPPDTVSHQPSIVMDVTASILTAAGAQVPTNLDGENIIPILSGGSQPHPRTFFWRLPRPDNEFGQKAVRRGKWKYIHDRDTDLLFDLEQDRGERHNLAYEHPDIVKDLKQALADWEKTLPPPAEVRPK